MNRRTYGTNHVIWFFATFAIFVAIGFVNLGAGVTKGNGSLWANVWMLFELWQQGRMETVIGQFIPGITIQSTVLLIPAALVGWLVQALTVIAWPRMFEPSKSD